MNLPRCPCGKKSGRGQHRKALAGLGVSSHVRTNRRDEIKSCAGCYSHYDMATQQRDPRTIFQAGGTLAHPLGHRHATTLNCSKDERTGWVRRGDRFW